MNVSMISNGLRLIVYVIPPVPHNVMTSLDLLQTGSEERGVLGVGNTPVTILPSSQDMKTMAL